MLTKNMAEFSATIKAHAAADLIEQGKYYDDKTGRGCFIGCLAHGDDIGLIATKYGLPMPLTRLLEHVFERLDADNARAFFAAIPDAIGGNGRDLGRVHWAFLGDILRHMPPQPTDIQAVIDPVIEGMDLLARGENWEAAEAAWAAAVAEAAVAEAARAAEAARSDEIIRQRDALLRMIREA